jgi:hypothetical protein
MSDQQSLTDDHTDTDDTDDVQRRPERPADTKAVIMHDTGIDYFESYVNNCERIEVLEQYLDIETDRDDPRRNRIGMANKRLQELQ